MKNEEITMLELFKLIKDGNPPKKIHWTYTPLKDDKIYIWYDCAQGYYEENHAGESDYKLLAHRNEQFSKILNSIVEIISEENDEWEDIEEIRMLDLDKTPIIINQLIKNQKYLKERLDKNDCVFEQEKVSFKQYINEKLESKDE